MFVRLAVRTFAKSIAARLHVANRHRCKRSRTPARHGTGVVIAVTPVYDAYWKFAAERQAIYKRRCAGDASQKPPFTTDPILSQYKFTNAYRASDRVSQFLIRRVQYDETLSQSKRDLVFRTLLFKFFNKIETWNLLETHLNVIDRYEDFDFQKALDTLTASMLRKERIYSAAYIIPQPNLGLASKAANHLSLLWKIMNSGLIDNFVAFTNLGDLYTALLTFPGLGEFLAFQFAVDINYSDACEFTETDFVIAGPGALDGIAKCFTGADELTPEEIIFWMHRIQTQEFERLGLTFDGLWGRPLMPIDCQNLFCEISKYARVAFPEIKGKNDRMKIKQNFTISSEPLPKPFFPPKWGINANVNTGR